MSDATQQSPDVRPAPSEQYSHGYGAAADHMAQRPVAPNIAFFLPHLRPGMSLLDCGCGPGTNTVALAEVVAPGPVVGMDLNESQIELARASAARQGVTNIRFEVGDVYALPFPDASFDAAFAHTVLQHLKAPAKALEEISRVLKPGGLVGVRESDMGSAIRAPHDPIVEQWVQLYYRFWQHNGGDPFMARNNRQLLREAGFTDIMATALTECRGDVEAMQYWGEGLARLTLEPTFADRVIALGWADRQTLEKMAATLRAWGTHPDAFFAVIYCEAVGWKR
jgi:ubiquinone/menaquinone biosynthesis C-methylase UbiE